MADLWTRIHRDPAPAPLQGVEAFEVSDILRMFWEGPDDILDWDKLPNVAPPFRSYFMYGHAPILRASGRETVTRGEQGALFSASKSSLGGWTVQARLVGGDEAFWQPQTLSYHVLPTGEIDEFENGNRFVLSAPFDMRPTLVAMGISEEDAVSGFAGAVYPFMLATSILHCKNVTAKRVLPPPKLARAAERRGRPIYSYSVLDVRPMRRTLNEEGGMERGASLAKALHVCRGHFKDYRDGAGLFGRHKGLFWWEQSLRGDVANGVHVKDYKVGVA